MAKHTYVHERRTTYKDVAGHVVDLDRCSLIRSKLHCPLLPRERNFR